MSPESTRRRPRRIPYSPEEVANIIAFKKRKEQIVLQAFKKTKAYKYQNLFNIICFFIYWEILFCLFGPAYYTLHQSVKVAVDYGNAYDMSGKPIVEEMEFYDNKGHSYKFMINEFVSVPNNEIDFMVGSDFILQKELKGSYSGNDNTFHLFNANPIMLIILLTLVTSSMAYYYNLNQNSYSLMSLTVLNSLTFLGLICI